MHDVYRSGKPGIVKEFHQVRKFYTKKKKKNGNFEKMSACPHNQTEFQRGQGLAPSALTPTLIIDERNHFQIWITILINIKLLPPEEKRFTWWVSLYEVPERKTGYCKNLGKWGVLLGSTKTSAKWFEAPEINCFIIKADFFIVVFFSFRQIYETATQLKLKQLKSPPKLR